MNLTLECRDYQGNPSYVLKSGKVVADKDPSDFLIKVKTPFEEMLAYLKDALMEFPEERKDLRLAGLDILVAYQESVRYWYGSDNAPHNLCGGLLFHMYNMTRAAQKMAEIYPLNKEILIFSAMFCDIGKLQSILTSKTGTVENTKSGLLFGSAYLGMEMLKQEFAEYGVPEEVAQCVLHCVVAHYGEIENRAAVRPLTMEAKMIGILECIDTSMNLFSQTLDDLTPGSFSGKVSGLNSPVYRPEL